MPKALKIVSYTAGTAVLLTVAVLLLLANMLLDPKPQSSPAQLTGEDFKIQNRILGHIFRSLTKRKVPETAELKLNPQEFQSVIRCADLIAGEQEIPLRDYQPSLSQGRLILTVPYDTKQKWLFGGWIISHLELKVSKQDEKLDIEVLSAKAGKFKVSNETAQKIVDNLAEKLRQSRGYERFDKLVETLSIDRDGILTIKYRPRNAIFLLKR